MYEHLYFIIFILIDNLYNSNASGLSSSYNKMHEVQKPSENKNVQKNVLLL